MRTLISWLVYLPLQIVAIPVALLGVVIVGYRQVVVSKKLGVSHTAIEIINGRWTMHIFGMRDDPGAAKLAPMLPNTSTLGLWLVFAPLWVKAKIAGKPAIYPRSVDDAAAGLADMVMNRTIVFDRVINRQLETAEQFVVLGAGLDTRAYGSLDLGQKTTFELDQASTQQLKCKTLRAAGIDASHVRFVTVDFETEDPFEKLASEGYDPHKKTVFLWEGVTLYLPEVAIRETLSSIRDNSAPGSVVVADFYGARLLAMAQIKGARESLELTGEGLQFTFSFAKGWEEELAGFVKTTSLTQGETVFIGTDHKKGPFMAVVELTV